MRFDLYGRKNLPCILLLHTMFTTGELFAYVARQLEDNFFVVVPTLDGFEPDGDSVYQSADEELNKIVKFLRKEGITEMDAVAGSSLGAMLSWRLYERQMIPIHRLYLDSPPFNWDRTVQEKSFINLSAMVESIRKNPYVPCALDVRYGKYGRMMRDICTRVTEETIRNSCVSCFGPSIPKQIDRTDTDLFIMYGDQDPNYLHISDSLKSRNDLTVLIQPGFGHCDYLMKCPKEFRKQIIKE